MSNNIENESINEENQARINGLRQVLNMTADDNSARNYAKAAGIEITDIPDMRRSMELEIRTLEGNPPSLDEIKADAIMVTRFLLVKALENPITFNGKQYSVTLEKQNLLSAQLGIFGLNTQAGIPTELTWNATGQPCEPWTFEDLLALSNAMRMHVTPLVQKQRDTEVSIKKARTEKEVQNVITKYTKQLDGATSL